MQFVPVKNNYMKSIALTIFGITSKMFLFVVLVALVALATGNLSKVE